MYGDSLLPAVPSSAPAARAAVRRAASDLGLDGRSTWELMLATTEAVANAVEHGEPGPIRLKIERTGDCLAVEVRNRGPFAHRPDPLAPASHRGRGIPIMTAVVDRLELHPGDRCTRVRFTKRLRAA